MPQKEWTTTPVYAASEIWIRTNKPHRHEHFLSLSFVAVEWQRSLPLFATHPGPQETLITPPVHLEYWFVNNIVKIPLAVGQGNIFSVHVAILMRWGVLPFSKCHHQQRQTVNQFPNPKVSDVERGRKAMGAICYSSLEWISPPSPCLPLALYLSQHLWRSLSLSYTLFQAFFFLVSLSLQLILGHLHGN